MNAEKLLLKRTMKAVLMILLLGAAGMMKGYAYEVEVTLGTNSHGSVVAPTTANEGETVTLTASPDIGYGLERWIIIDENNRMILVTPDEDNCNVGTFTMPASNVTVTAQFETALSIDFEQEASAYTDWTFTSYNSQQSGEIVPHGGTFYGSIVGNEANFQTSSPIAHPLTLSFFVYAEVNSSSEYRVEISSNGENWQSKKQVFNNKLNQNEWTKVSVDLSTYFNVYIRIRFVKRSNGNGYVDDCCLTFDNKESQPVYRIGDYWNYDYDIYVVSSFNSAHGNSCRSDKYSAIEGQLVTLIAHPNEEYNFHVNSWKVFKYDHNGSNLEEDEIDFFYTDDPNKIVFIMPASDVGYYATFDTDLPFHSVTLNELSFEAYEYCSVGTKLGEIYLYETGIGVLAGETVTIHVENIADGYCLNYLEVYNIDDPYGDPIPVYYNSEIFGPFNYSPFKNCDFTFTMPDGDVIIRYDVVEYPYVYYKMVKDVDDLIPGKHYIIVGGDDTNMSKYYMYEQGGNHRSAYNEIIEGEVARPLEIFFNSAFPFYEFVLSGSTEEKWTIYDEHEGNSKGYLYAASSDSDQLKNRAEFTDNNSLWNIEIAPDGKATITAQGDNTHNIIRFAPNTNNYSNSSFFSCYANSNEQYPVYIFKKMAQDIDYDFYSNTTIESLELGENEWYDLYSNVGNQYQRCTIHSSATLTVTDFIENNTGDAIIGWNGFEEQYRYAYENLVIESGGQLIANNEVWGMMQKHIAAHSTNEGWYFIASPLIEVITPDEDNGFINGTIGQNNNTYDLYYYDEAEHQWRNYEGEYGIFDIVPQQGYLYANSVDTDLSFIGTLQPSNEAITIPEDNLSYSSDVFTGFNLVGNPFPCKATLNRSYYVIEGRNTIPCEASIPIDPCTGVMVQVTSNDKNVTFTRLEPVAQASSPRPSNLLITVTQNGNNRDGISVDATLQDNAIISFDENGQLEKIVLNADASKLYIPQDGKDYAIAVSKKQGEMPVNFLAAKNGNYTLSVNPKGVKMSYLHLIDNMTGANVDLLQTPTYIFSATTNDKENRFHLVFSASN